MAQWPNSAEVAELEVGGMLYRDWETILVKHALYYPAYSARFTCSEESPRAKGWAALRIRPGMECSVRLAGELALTGTVYSRQVYYDARRVHVEIQAVGLPHKLIEETVQHSTYEWRNNTWEQFARSVLGPTGIQLETKGAPDGDQMTPFDHPIRVSPDAKVFETLQNYANQKQIRLTSNVGGQLVAIYGPFGGGGSLIEGKNILIGREIIFNRSIYQGTAIGQRTGNNKVRGALAAQLSAAESAAASVFGGGGKAPMQIHKGEVAAGKGILKGRINTERLLNESDAITVTCTVQGWLVNGVGALWGPPGIVVSVVSPMLIMAGGEGLRAKTITFTQDNETGTRTTLELCNETGMGSTPF